MAVARYLVDTSAWARLDRPSVSARLDPLVERRLVATCGPVTLELLYAARNRDDHRRQRAALADLEALPVDDRTFARAVEVQAVLAEQSQLRQVGVADLLVAATAELARVALLHYDADFDAVAAITGQATEWVVPRGSVP